MELNEIKALIALLRATGVTEYHAPDGLVLHLGPAPQADYSPVDPRASLSPAGRAMADAMDRMDPNYRRAFEVR